MTRRITIRYASFRECPNCKGRGNDGASWRPLPCKRCEGRGKLVATVEVEDSARGMLPPSTYDFNAKGEVFLLDFDDSEEFEVVHPEDPWG
jgi:RecJ-like exonuclease